MWHWRVFAALFTILSLGSATAQSRLGLHTQLWMQADKQAAEILVIVIDPSGVAVGNALISLKDAQQIQASGGTDEAGLLRLNGLCAGSYTLEVAAQGYPVHRENIKLGPRSVAEIQIRLDMPTNIQRVTTMGGHTLETITTPGQQTAGIALQVVDLQGAVIARAKVQFKGEKGELLAEGVTSKAGSLTLAGLPDGLYSLEVSAQGFKVHQETVKTEAGKTTNVQIKLDINDVAYVCSPCVSFVEIQTSIEPTSIPYVRVIPLPCDQESSFKRFFGKLFH